MTVAHGTDLPSLFIAVTCLANLASCGGIGAAWNVTVGKADNDSIVISWNPPLDPAPISHYNVMYKSSADLDYKQLNEKPIKPPTTEYLTQSLQQNTQYRFIVAAYSISADRVDSDEIEFDLFAIDKQLDIVGIVVAAILLLIIIVVLTVWIVTLFREWKSRKTESPSQEIAIELVEPSPQT